MADVALKKVSARLASLLLRLLRTEGVVTREGVGIRTRYTHEQFATMIGAKRVAVSRAMGEVRELGAVEAKGSEYTSGTTRSSGGPPRSANASHKKLKC